MQFGKALGTACSTFVITNIDDLFVLVTFFAESSVNKKLTPAKITIGQYLGFTVIIIASLTGFAVAQAIPSEPIGFFGLLPLLLGIWKGLELLFPDSEEKDEDTKATGAKNILKVASITVMNGGDNIGTYIPLFAQAKGAEIAIYVVTYYILLGAWCFVGFLIMKEKHILRVAQKYAHFVIPFLYIGLGIFIIVDSDCYPWSIQRIDDRFLADPGRTILAIMTAFFLLACIGTMVCIKLRKKWKMEQNMSNQDTELQASKEPGKEETLENNPEAGDVDAIAPAPAAPAATAATANAATGESANRDEISAVVPSRN